MKRKKYFLFDLDGTLIDTTPLIIESFKYTFLKHMNENICEEQILEYMGMPLIAPFETLNPEYANEMVLTYREYNEKRHDRGIGIFIGIYKVLTALKAQGCELGVVTSKRKELALRGMSLFSLDKLISLVVAYEDTVGHKPGPEPILKALELLGAPDKKDVIYVGDTPHDIMCAKKAGIESAAVSWSLVNIDSLKDSRPEYFLDKPADLLALSYFS